MKRASRRSGVKTLFRKVAALKAAALLAGVAATTLLPLNAYSTQREVVTTITRLYAYTSGIYDGDIVVELANPPAQCAQGFWISADDVGVKSAYALLISAYHTQAAVRIIGEDTLMWPGSSTAICRVIAVALD